MTEEEFIDLLKEDLTFQVESRRKELERISSQFNTVCDEFNDVSQISLNQFEDWFYRYKFFMNVINSHSPTYTVKMDICKSYIIRQIDKVIPNEDRDFLLLKYSEYLL